MSNIIQYERKIPFYTLTSGDLHQLRSMRTIQGTTLCLQLILIFVVAGPYLGFVTKFRLEPLPEDVISGFAFSLVMVTLAKGLSECSTLKQFLKMNASEPSGHYHIRALSPEEVDDGEG